MFNPMRNIPNTNSIKPGDYLVIFGELFNRGYVNGLVEYAQKSGINIIYSTVGRRDAEGKLRELLAEEISPDYSPLINIPLEAGFDLEIDSNDKSPCDYFQSAKLTNWRDFSAPLTSLNECREKGRIRFRKSLERYMIELESKIPKSKNVVFAHIMAGGVPRTKIILSLMNRVFKGRGDRYLSSEEFWDSPLGKFADLNFFEVTAHTLEMLIESSVKFRENRSCSFIAYGYHGTEIYFSNKFQWQSYSPYLQGWAKIQLENVAKKYFAKGIPVSVYNCPEILTNSSSIFQGVEVPLYTLLAALKIYGEDYFSSVKPLLKDGVTQEMILEKCESYLSHPQVLTTYNFESWPTHSTQDQLQLLLNTSDELIEMHKDAKNLITLPLSEIVLNSCGELMLKNAMSPSHPVNWIGHDIIAKCHAR